MFGSSGGNGRESNSNAVAVDGGQTDGPPASPTTATPSSASNPMGPVEENKDETPSDVRSPTKGSESAQSLEKKRRSSGVGRARDLFSSAKQSLRDMGTSSPEHRNPGGSPQTPMQKLGKLDPAL
ncbi:mgpp2cl-1, protein phosphatase 2C-like protein 1, partial [Friedmanniomyces endolithicus]